MKRWRSLRVLLAVCVAGALASAVEMALLYSPGDVNRVYYGTDTRAQSLLIGAALAAGLAMWAQRRGVVGDSTAAAVSRPPRSWRGLPLGAPDRPGPHRGRWSWGSPALWGAPSCGPASPTTTPSPTGAASSWPRWPRSCVLFSVVCSPGSPLAWLLSVRPLRFIGRISYGLYLWHFPLFIYIDHARTGSGGLSSSSPCGWRQPWSSRLPPSTWSSAHPAGHPLVRDGGRGR